MAQGKLTGWFPANVKPVRKGVYQRKGYVIDFSYWTGERWSTGAGNAKDAYAGRFIETVCRDFPWRGLRTRSRS